MPPWCSWFSYRHVDDQQPRVSVIGSRVTGPISPPDICDSRHGRLDTLRKDNVYLFHIYIQYGHWRLLEVLHWTVDSFPYHSSRLQCFRSSTDPIPVSDQPIYIDRIMDLKLPHKYYKTCNGPVNEYSHFQPLAFATIVSCDGQGGIRLITNDKICKGTYITQLKNSVMSRQ